MMSARVVALMALARHSKLRENFLFLLMQELLRLFYQPFFVGTWSISFRCEAHLVISRDRVIRLICIPVRTFSSPRSKNTIQHIMGFRGAQYEKGE